MGTALLWVGRVFILVVGLGFLLGNLHGIVDSVRLFTDPRYQDFWSDVRNYHLQTEGCKTERQLALQYGPVTISPYVLAPSLGGACLPSEDAALASITGFILVVNKRHEDVLERVALDLFLIYGSMLITIRLAQRLLTKCACLTRRSRSARMAYMRARAWRPLLLAWTVSFSAAIFLSFVNAHVNLSPEMEARGITVPELAAGLFWAGTMSGLGLLIVSSLVDTGFLAIGIDPHGTIWDDVLSLLIVTPFLFFVFQNSLLTVATGVLTGLASGVFMKFLIRRRRRSTMEALPFSLATNELERTARR